MARGMPARTILGPGLAILVPLLLAGCGAKEPEAAKPRPVRVTKPMILNEHFQAFSGVVVPRTDVQAAFRTGGRIAARLVEVGDRVVKGQPLARLDPADLDLALKAAEARLAQAVAQDIQAAANLKRYTPLVASGAVSQAQFDNVKATADAAAAQKREATAALEQARNQRAYATLTLEQAGTVTAVLADAGQVVAAGQTVLRIATDQGREVEIEVSEADIARLKPGMKAKAYLWADDTRVTEGTIREIGAAADSISRTFRVRIALPAGAEKVAALGGTARVYIDDEDGTGQVSVPPAALFFQGDKPAVWVLAASGDRVELRPVEVAAYGSDAIILKSGIKEGDLVISAGANRLDPNLPVRVWDGGLP